MLSNVCRFFVFLVFSLIAAGCSVHPLPSDVVGLDVFQIVHKVECEAADVIKDRFAASDLNSQISALKSAQEDLQKSAKKLNEKIAKLNTSEYGTSGQALEDASGATVLQAKKLQAKTLQIIKEHGPNPSRDTDPVGYGKSEAVRQEADLLIREYALIQDYIKLLKESNEESKALAEKSKSINKRFENLLAIQGHNVVLELELGAKEENNALASGTLKWPLTLGVLSLNYGAGDKKTRDAQRTIKLAASFAELNDLSCGDLSAEPQEGLPLRYPIKGDIGLNEVMNTYLKIAFGPDPGDWKKSRKFKSGGESYQDKITFTTALNAGLKPSLDITKGHPQLAQGVLDVNATRTDTHKVTVFITPPSDKSSGDKAQGIIVQQMPALRVRTNNWRSTPEY